MKREPRYGNQAADATFRRAMEAYPDALLLCCDGRILYANAACLRLLAAPDPAQILGKTPLDFVHPDHRQRVQERIAERIAAGTPSPLVPEKLVRLDGAVVEVEVAVLPYGEAHNALVHVLLRDRIACTEALKALHDSEEQFGNLFDQSPLGMGMIGLDFSIRRVNARFCQMLGYAPEELRACTIADITHPDDVASGLARARRLMFGEIPSYVVEKRYLTREGRVVWVRLHASMVHDSQRRPRYALATVEDITERKEAEARWQRGQEAAMHTAFDILASQTGREALEHLAEMARHMVGARYGAIGVASPDGDGLADFIPVGLTPARESRIGARPSGQGLLGELLESDGPVRLDDLVHDPRFQGFPPHHPRMKRFLGVPIRLGQVTLGSLYLADRKERAGFTERDTALVQTLAPYIAVAIRNFQMLQRQRVLIDNLLNAQEEERRTVAYDLHDGLTQYVMASHAFLESFQEASATGQEEPAQEALEAALRYLREAVRESRRLINGLRALALEDLGLVGAIDQLLQEEKERAGWQEATFLHSDLPGSADLRTETAAFRVAQELLTNARKHAETLRVQVVLRAEPAVHGSDVSLMLEVRDWGRGFDAGALPSDAVHVGLHSMSERLRLLEGNLEIRSAPGAGTTVRATFPRAFRRLHPAKRPSPR